MSGSDDSVHRAKPGFIAKLRSFVAHPALFVPAALIGLASGVVALWFRLADVEALEGLYRATQVDLRFAALAFGSVGTSGALLGKDGGSAPVPRIRRVVAYAGIAAMLLGLGLLVFGLISAMVAHLVA